MIDLSGGSQPAAGRAAPSSMHGPATRGEQPSPVSKLNSSPLSASPRGLLLIGAVLAAMSVRPGAAALLVLLWLVAGQMPGPVLRRWAFAVLVIVGLNAACLTAAAVLRVDVHPTWVVCTYVLFAAGIAGVRWLRRLRSGPSSATRATSVQGLTSAVDTWAAALAAVVFLLFYRPFHQASPGEVAALLSYSTDGATHLQLVRATMENNGYLHLLPYLQGVQVGLADYPGGWAGSMAVILELLLPPSPPHAAFLSLAAPLIVGLYALLTYFALAVALEAARQWSPALGRGGKAAATSCLAVPAAFGSGSLLLLSSSYAQIAATTAILASMLLFLTVGGRAQTTWVLAALAVVVAHTWYLLAPVFAAIVVMHAGNRRLAGRHLWAAAVPTTALCLYPVLTGPGPGSQLNAAGGTFLLSIWGTTSLLLLTGLVLVLLLVPHRDHRPQRLILAAPLVAGTLLTISVLFFQEGTGSGNNYYVAKLFYSLFLLASVAAAALLARAVARALPFGRSVVNLVLCALIPLALLTGAWAVHRDVRPFLKGQAPPDVSVALLDRMLADHPRGLRADEDVWVLSCNKRGDRKVVSWFYGFSLTWDDAREDVFESSFSTDQIDALKNRSRTRAADRVQVYVATTCAPGRLADLATLPGVVLTYA